jgi:hypothetical protein
MITGFNTNVRHGGRLYHVQTEDSGRNNPRVISHLYHGGTILASEKRDYTDLLGTENLSSAVRRLMERQHKAMLDRLHQGEFDAVIAQRLEDTEKRAGAEAAAGKPEQAEGPSEPTPEGQPARAFGEGIVSQKPLDEVILEYLVDKARDRAADAAARPGRGSRSRE